MMQGIPLRRVALAILLAAVMLWVMMHRGQLDVAALEVQIGNLGLLAPLGFMVVFALATVLFVPGVVFSLIGGALFGPFWGTLYNLLGASLGATLAFLAARYIASDWVARKSAGRLKQLIAGVEAEGWRFVALTRLVPLFPFNLLNYALGLTRIRLAHYVIATLICMAPGAAAYTWLGHAGREAAAGNSSALNYGLSGLALLALVAFLPGFLRRLRTALPKLIHAAEFKQRIERGKDMVVVDVRSPQEFVGPLGHIAGARNLPVAELRDRIDELVPAKTRPIIVVCRTEKRSAQAAGFLNKAGFVDVLILRGGMEQWNREGYAVEQSCDRPTP